jgi:hypothetical protein
MALENAVKLADAFIRHQVLQLNEGSREQQEEFQHIKNFCSQKNYKVKPCQKTYPTVSCKQQGNPLQDHTLQVIKKNCCVDMFCLDQLNGSGLDESEESCHDEHEDSEVEGQQKRDLVNELERVLVDPEVSDQYKDKDFLVKFTNGLKNELLKIFRNEIPSMRHRDFFSPRPSIRNRLKYQTGFGPIKSDEMQEVIVEELHEILTAFEPRDNFNQNNYVFEVMLPEVRKPTHSVMYYNGFALGISEPYKTAKN